MYLTISERTLMVFVDNTGHEALLPGHPVCGLSGSAVMVAAIFHDQDSRRVSYIKVGQVEPAEKAS